MSVDYPRMFARLSALLGTVDASPELRAFVEQLRGAAVFDDVLVFKVLECWDDRLRAAYEDEAPVDVLAEMGCEFLAELRGEGNDAI